jgi:hypothetical protein
MFHGFAQLAKSFPQVFHRFLTPAARTHGSYGSLGVTICLGCT